MFTVFLGVLLLAVPWPPDSTPRPTSHLAAPVPSPFVPYFIQNVGQVVNQDIAYYGQGHRLAVGFTNRAVLLRITEESLFPPRLGGRFADDGDGPTRAVLVRIAFLGANSVPSEGREELPYRTNFLLGNDPMQWRTDVPSYREVVYRNLYDGVDLVYRASDQGLKYEFIVNGNSDPAQIRLSYEGVNGLSLDSSGDLLVSTAPGELRDTAPVAYRGGRPVPCSYALFAPTTVGLRCADPGGQGPLVIDPLVYSTFLGGAGADQAWGVTVDATGSAYVTGSTLSPDFPTTPGVFNASALGGRDAFVAKLNATGSGLVYSTYLGGAGYDEGFAIAVDAGGNAFVAGRTKSPDFPTTPGAFDRTCGTDGNCNQVGAASYYDAFVAKLNPAGDALVYATFLGGGGDDVADSVALDDTGAAYVIGFTESPDLPTTPGAFDRTCGTDGNCNFDFVDYYPDVFLAKVSPAGDALSYSTFLGGASRDFGASLKVDSMGNAYITGDTQSDDFPTTPDAFQRIRGTDNSGDAFVAKVNPSGSALAYSTFLGGSGGDEHGTAIAIDSRGDAYLAGMTFSTDFPTTPGAFDRTFNSGAAEYDAYVAKLNATGGGLLYSTFLGGSGQDGWAQGNLGVTAAGNAFITGITNSANFPTTPGAYDRSWNGDYDAVVAELNATGGGLVYSTFLGGLGTDFGRSLALDAAGDAYIVGMTASADFPTTAGSFRVTPAGGADAFVAKLAPLADLAVSEVAANPAPPLVAGLPATIVVNVTNVGDIDAGPFSVLAFEDRNGNGRFDPGEDIASQGAASLSVFMSASLSYPWTPDAPGPHRVCAVADAANAVREGNETNNLGCADIVAVSPPVVRPDYTPVAPQPASPATTGLGIPMSLSVQVINSGNASANRTATLAFYNETTPTIPFATFGVAPLAPSAMSARFAASWTSPPVSGTYRVIADVDYQNDILEWNETDNVYSWTVIVVPGPFTSLAIGQPNYTAGETYVTSATPLSFSVVDQSGAGIRRTAYRVDNGTWTEYTITDPFTLVGDGEHFVEWYSEDNANGTEVVGSRLLRLDDTPPTTTAFIGEPKYTVGSLYVTSVTPITLLAMDGGGAPVGLTVVEYRIDGGTWRIHTVPFTVDGSDGPHTIAYRASDRLGNAANVTISVILDDTPPTTTLAPATGRNTTATMFTLSVMDEGSGVDGTEYRMNGGPWTTYAGAFSLAAGDHVVSYRSVDRLGNREQERTQAIRVEGPPSPATNLKPIVAAVFAIVLVIVGAWSAWRAPWPSGSRRRTHAFVLLVLPFVAAEAATGVVSLLTGLLAVPPLLGAGTAVDAGILAAGLAVAAYRVRRWMPPPV